MSYLDDRRNFINAGRPLPVKKQYSINKISPKRQEKLDAQKVEGQDSDLVKWYRARMKQMTSYCAETHLRTETKIYRYAIMSICHLLPKAICKSVALHPLNWIELNPDFHFKFDAMSWEEKEKLGCWPIILQRLVMIYPNLDPSEHRHFPSSVLKYMQEKEPFV